MAVKGFISVPAAKLKLYFHTDSDAVVEASSVSANTIATIAFVASSHSMASMPEGFVRDVSGRSGKLQEHGAANLIHQIQVLNQVQSADDIVCAVSLSEPGVFDCLKCWWLDMHWQCLMNSLVSAGADSSGVVELKLDNTIGHKALRYQEQEHVCVHTCHRYAGVVAA